MLFKKNSELLCLTATLLLPIVILVALLISPIYIDYNRWDNFEYFTPIIEYSQSLWMSLEIPFWNPHQFMGTPLLGTGQAGPFYLGYFFSVLVTFYPVFFEASVIELAVYFDTSAAIIVLILFTKNTEIMRVL